jgi:cysteine synthase
LNGVPARLYVDLRPIVGRSLFLKAEGFNFAGSIKLKAAAEMVRAAERNGSLTAACSRPTTATASCA